MAPGPRLFASAALILALASSAFADTKDTYTLGTANGRMWAGMGDVGRLYYVVGLHDGVAALIVFAPNKSDAFTCQCTYEELITGISALYASDPAYARVPIIMMFRLQVARAKGATREQVDKEISDYLKSLATAEGPH